jgi:hypothetical protein
MTTDTRDPSDRFPTSGPERAPYDQYRFVTTADGHGIIYHVAETEEWIQAASTVALDGWR